MAGRRLEDQRRVGHAPRDRSEMILCPGARDDAMQADPPVRALEAHDAAVRGGTEERAARLRAECSRYHRRGHGRRRSARGAAGRVIDVPGVARLRSDRARGEFGRCQLAEDHGARGPQPRDDRCVLARDAALQEFRVRLGRKPRRVDDVLETDRDAVQWPTKRSSARLVCRRSRRGSGALAIHVHPRFDARLDGIDPIEKRLEQVLGR